MADENTEPKKRESGWITSYSKMSFLDAEMRLGFVMQELQSKAISVQEMLAKSKDKVEGGDDILKTKRKVYDRITEYLVAEGYPTESDADFKEANINDLVFSIIAPIIFDFRRNMRRDIRLRRKREIVGVDSESGYTEEFVMMDLISVMERNFIVVTEAKGSSFGEAIKQCLLAMKDMKDNNGDGGEVYGFVTTGETWQMLRYDGTSFQLSEEIEVLFHTMGKNRQRWIKDYSVLVDCMYVALSNGGIMKKDVVV